MTESEALEELKGLLFYDLAENERNGNQGT